jgi:pimeloyl-ACP methyl ester carboxylesterase
MSTAQTAFRMSSTPTVLLVHGAFIDGSSWSRVIPILQAAGLEALAPANPLRTLAGDAAYVGSVANEVDGPVLLVGHAYGGAVITAAAAQAANVVGLVFVAAYVLEEGESVITLNSRFPPSALNAALRPATFVNDIGRPGIDLYIKRDDFQRVFAADLPAAAAAVLAASQRPITAAALEELATVATWKTLPSWYAVASADRALFPEAQRFMARRAGSHTVEIAASHAVALAQPAAIADLIRAAAQR